MNEDTLTALLSDKTEPVYTGWIAENMGVDRQKLFGVLNGMAKNGRLVRSMILLENGTSRPTIGFGWSCPVD